MQAMRTMTRPLSQRTNLTSPRSWLEVSQWFASSRASLVSATLTPLHSKDPFRAHDQITIEGDGKNEQEPRDCQIPEGGDARCDEGLIDRVQEQGAKRGAQDRSASTKNRYAAHDRRRYGIKFVAGSGRRTDRREFGEPKRSRQSRKSSTDDEGTEDTPLNGMPARSAASGFDPMAYISRAARKFRMK